MERAGERPTKCKFILESANTGDGRLVVGMNAAQSSADDSPQNEKSSSGNIYAEYHHKDHLGNVRVAFTDRNDDHLVTLLGTANDIEITQQLDYYPFGLQQQGQGLFHTQQEPGNWYRFNGIEHNEETGLDLAFYRSYNPTLGRWMQIDPKSELMYGLSPYTGMMNSPIVYNDPEGDVAPLVGAMILSGVGNLASNWGNVSSFSEGAAYFANGAVSIAVASVNPLAGAGLYMMGELTVRGLNGDLPSINNLADFANFSLNIGVNAFGVYIGGLGLATQYFNAGGQLTAEEVSMLAKDGIVASTTASAGIGARQVAVQTAKTGLLNNSQIRVEAIKALEHANYKQAIELLRSANTTVSVQHTVIMQSSRLNRIEKAFRQGTVTYENYNVEMNQIAEALITTTLKL